MKHTRLIDWLGSTLMLAALGLLWWEASQGGWVSKVFLPTPHATWQSLVEGFTSGDLLAQTEATLGRMLMGWVLASILGIALGMLIGSSELLRSYLQPTFEFIRPLPASAVMPLGIAVFGLNPGMVLFVVAFGAMWPVLLATLYGFNHIHPRLREVSHALQLSPVSFAFKMGLPNAMPDILAGMRLSLTVSLIVSVVGEMIASQSGLGQAVLLAARAFRASELFAGVILLSSIGIVSNAALSLIERRVLRWQNR